MSTINTQLVVIGSGPAGYTSAFRAADLGIETVLIEKDEVLGGVCLNRGCIPSKTLLHVAELIDEIHDSSKWGVLCEQPTIDLPKIRAQRDKVIERLNKGLAFQCKSKKIKVVSGEATFAGNNSLSIKKNADNISSLEFEHAILATGSEPFIPKLFEPIDKLVLDSTKALALKEIPKKLCVIGAGAIGLELGSVYASLGSEVTIVEMLPEMLPGVDRDIIAVLNRTLMKKFHKVYLDTKVVKTELVKKSAILHLEGKINEALSFDAVLVAAGRKSNFAALNLKLANIELENNRIKVNKKQQTTNEKIYAVGDITQGPMLAHKGYYDGKVAAEVVAGKETINDAQAIPSVIYTMPQIATVGFSESEAKEKGIKVRVAKFNWVASGKALSMGKESGLTKVLVSEEDRIIGAQIIGANAGELIAEATLAIEMGAHYEDVALTIHAHPTLSEGIAEALETLQVKS